MLHQIFHGQFVPDRTVPRPRPCVHCERVFGTAEPASNNVSNNTVSMNIITFEGPKDENLATPLDLASLDWRGVRIAINDKCKIVEESGRDV